MRRMDIQTTNEYTFATQLIGKYTTIHYTGQVKILHRCKKHNNNNIYLYHLDEYLNGPTRKNNHQ